MVACVFWEHVVLVRVPSALLREHKPGEKLCGGMNLAKNSSDIMVK